MNNGEVVFWCGAKVTVHSLEFKDIYLHHELATCNMDRDGINGRKKYSNPNLVENQCYIIKLDSIFIRCQDTRHAESAERADHRAKCRRGNEKE